MNSEESTVTEETAASVTNTVIMDNNDNPANIVKVICENNAEHTRPVNNRSNNNDYWAEIENEDLILNLGPPAIVVLKNSEENTTESSPSPSLPISSISTTATTVESVTSRLLRKRDELAKKYGIGGEGKHEQTDNKVDLSTTNDGVETAARREQTLDEFKADLRLKRLARQTAVQDLRNEIQTLRSRLVDTEDETLQNKEENLCLNAVAISDEDDEDPMSRGRHANIELANVQLALQMANAENLTLSTELATVQKQVVALKEVIACCKQMLVVKEDQCTQLKSKLDEIESSLAERELKLMSNHLRVEYERQLENIRQLRELYEERQRISAAEHENLQRLISLKRDELKAEQEKTKTAEERNQTLLQDLEKVNTELAALREECDEHKFEKKALKEEIGTVNTLFSQMVTGFNGRDNLDIDRLTTMLEENRTLLNDMATKEMANDGATLPKLLFELVEQAAVASEKNTSRSTTPVTIADAEADVVDNAAEANVDIKTNMKEVTAISEGVAAGGSVGNKQNAEPDVKNDDEDATAICYGTLEETASLQATLHTSPSSFETQEMATATATATASVTATTTTPSTVSTGTCTSGLDATKSGRKHYRRTTPTKATDDMKTTTNTATTVHSGKTMKFAEPEVIGKVVSTQEIIGNLPKVWKVLMELLSHHKIERVPFEENGSSEDCYKSVQTPNGIKTELSVSKTYIKLKDLILEKKSLVKETNRLKTLNCHLEYRLNEQEKRLSTVSLELTKTWHLVGKMQRQHRQLHTQEQILRYQLQQKRRLLSELKDELEYCRRKWALARAKNDESMEQCNDLRREFAQRKIEDANNSTESGYSDSGPPSEDEAGAVLPPVPNCRRIILREMFEHTRKIKRMQSTSPRRAVYNLTSDFNSRSVTLLRCNSAPPSLGCRDSAEFECENDDEEFDIEGEHEGTPLSNVQVNKGAIPKVSVPRSASVEKDTVADPLEPEIHANRIHRLEEQCKSLIVQVMETSDNRERLEMQLSRLQDEVTPGQYLERMTRASSAPASGCLTPREEEYTRKRSERLGRLEEESKQLMSRIRRTADRGHYLRCSLDRIRRAPSREGSLESNAEEENPSNNMELEVNEKENTTDKTVEKSPLTSTEQEYIDKRAERLKRLEEESKALLNRVSLHNDRTDEISGPVNNIETRIHNIDKISENRNERLRILEEEGKALLTKLSNTSARGTAMINRIAEREQRLADSQRNTDASETEKDDLLKDSTEAAYIPPIPNNVASTSIASPELSEGLVITTTPSQIAYQQGAIPKTLKPNAQLSVSRTKNSKRSTDTENLEDLVKSLKNLPYPQDDESKQEEEQETETENLEKDNK